MRMRQRKKCPHGRFQYDCKECNGKGICVHQVRYRACLRCHVALLEAGVARGAHGAADAGSGRVLRADGTAGVAMPEEIKEEPVEEYDGTYVCFICSKSVRGRDALQCSQCQSNPFHRACVAKYPGWAESCATCEGQTIEDWSLKSTSSAAPIDMIDLRSGSEGLGRRKDEENAKECDVRNLAARVHVLEEERSRAAEAATREEETRKSYEDRLKQQADRIHVLEEEQRRAVLTQAEAATREEETRKSYEDRLKQQTDRIHVLEEEVSALTQEVSQSQVRAKLQKRERTEAGGKDPACELPSKKAAFQDLSKKEDQVSSALYSCLRRVIPMYYISHSCMSVASSASIFNM